MRTMIQGLLVLGLACAGLAGCNSEDPFPTTPTPPPTTVSFSGNLTPNGAQTFQFTTQANGAVTATLTTVEPAGATVGLALGVWNAATEACFIVAANDNAVQGSVLTGTASSVGTYCVRLFDAGALTAAAAFSVQVVHP